MIRMPSRFNSQILYEGLPASVASAYSAFITFLLISQSWQTKEPFLKFLQKLLHTLNSEHLWSCNYVKCAGRCPFHVHTFVSSWHSCVYYDSQVKKSITTHLCTVSDFAIEMFDVLDAINYQSYNDFVLRVGEWKVSHTGQYKHRSIWPIALDTIDAQCQ